MAAGTSNGRWVSPPEMNPAAKAENFRQKTRRVLHQQFSAVDILFVLISLITYILDLVTDCLLAWQYFRDGHSVCGIWTLVFICVPTLTLQLLSLRWYHSQGRQLCCSWTLAAHLFLCGPVERYVSVLRYGHEARRSQQPVAYERLYQAHNDVSILRFVEAFMESAPQLILQGYFSLTTQSITWVTGVSLALSLVSLAWSVAAYSNALRLAYRERYLTHWSGLVVQTLSHSCTVASRVLAIVIFATVFHQWTFLPIGLHWAAMSLWVLVQGPDFFPHRWENRLFSLVLGVVHIFCFLNLKDGRSRWRMWPFYTLILAENGLLTGLWYREHATVDPLMIVVTSVVFGGFLLGVLWLLAYYRLCHPSGHIYLWGEDKAAPCEEPTQMEPQRRKIFDASLVSHSPFSHEGYNLSLDSSWSGLVHSRRGETPFTASRYDTSTTGPYLEDNKTCTARKPDDVCNKVFDTPLCGGMLPNKKTEALETGIKGAPLAVSESCGMSSQLSDSCHISLSSIRSVLSSDMHESVGSGYGSGLGCVSLDLSANTRSVSQISRQVGYDNAAFSVGSLRSGKSLQEAGAKVQGPTNRLSSTPATFTVSLPSLVHLSSSQIDRRNNSDENQSHHSSVFAITGTPNSSSNLSMHKSGETSTYHPKSIQDRMRMLRGARQFDHTQSMQCITSRRHHFDTRTLPMKQKKSRSKMRSSCESLSSLSSYHKPRPLSPLNVNTLWEESVIRFNKSCELESSVSVMKSVNEETCDEDAESFSAPQKEESLGSLSDDQNSSLQKCTESPGVNKSLSSRSLNRSDSRSHISEESVSKSNLISPNSSGNLKNSEMSSVSSGIGDPTKDRPDFSGHSEDSNNRWFCLSSRRNGDDSSGFESSGLDQSGSFFDYSDSVPNQSKHTLSDLAGRLAVALDLNSSADKQVEHPSLGSSTAGFNLAQSSHLNPAYSDTPWRVDYLRRIPTPILQQSHLSCYSASDRSLSLASDMDYMERSRLGSSAYFGLPDHVSAEISKATSSYLNGHQNPACFGNRTPLKIYNLTKSPRAGKPGRTQGSFHEKLHLEDYADSPYKHTQKRRQSHNKSTSPSLKLLGRSERTGFDSHARENLPRKVSSQSPHQISCQVKIERQNASSLSSSYSRDKHASICASSDSSKQSSGFSKSSESSCWDDVSYSDTAENISPMLQSWHKRTPKSANRQTSSTTPDCSPVELPPLTTGTGVLKPRQSYFSTPKVHIPGLESPSLHAENLTDDSFFGVEVPRLRLMNHNSKDAKLRTRPPLFSPKSPTERPNSGVGSRTDEDVKKSVRSSSSTDDFTFRNKKQPKHKIPEYKPRSFRI